MAIQTKKVVSVKYLDAAGGEHDSAVEAETENLAAVLAQLPPFDRLESINLRQHASVLVANKATLGPLLRVPITRARKTPEQKAAEAKAAKEAAAKKKAESAAKKLAAGK